MNIENRGRGVIGGKKQNGMLRKKRGTVEIGKWDVNWVKGTGHTLWSQGTTL